jgi:hypothetical protein
MVRTFSARFFGMSLPPRSFMLALSNIKDSTRFPLSVKRGYAAHILFVILAAFIAPGAAENLANCIREKSTRESLGERARADKTIISYLILVSCLLLSDK